MHKSILLIIVFIFSVLCAEAQSKKKPLYHSKDDVVTAAQEELDKAMSAPDGVIYLWAKEKNINGKYFFEVSIRDKGKVATVYCADREGGSLVNQSDLKDAIMDYEFNFKMPKGKSYKFKYTFDFNH